MKGYRWLFTPAQQVLAALAILSLMFSLVSGSLAYAVANPGAIWTTTGSCGDPQNINQYAVGESIYINGSNFTAGNYAWSIENANGSKVIASGNTTVGTSGNVCFLAKTLTASDIGGPYKAGVGTVKNDNFRVVDGPAATGNITIVKNVNDVSGNSINFNFTSTVPGHASFTLLGGASRAMLSQDAGSYTITEGTMPQDWSFGSVSCDSGSWNANGQTVTVNLAGNDNVTCTFNNTTQVNNECPVGYTGTFPDCVPPACPTDYTGTYPNCVAPTPQCPTGYTGTYPDCVAPQCPSGYTGTYPDCVAPTPECPTGYTGTYPNCVAPQECPADTTGVYPDCLPNPTCPANYTGTYPDCVAPACPTNYTGTYPDCVAPTPECPTGYTGTYPDCVAPQCPTGYTGTYPDCVPPATPQCQTGYTGTYPDCVAPTCPTGQTGTYPDCVPSICPTGYTGTYPNCVAPEQPAICTVVLRSGNDSNEDSRDDNTTVTERADAFAFITTPHPLWPTISGAGWLWGDATVQNTALGETQTFVRKFGWSGAVQTATLTVSSDDSHSVTVNGSAAGSKPSASHVSGQGVYDVKSFINTSGNNKLDIAVTNIGNNDPSWNPAGLAYKLEITGTGTCEIPYQEEEVVPTYTIDGYKWNDVDSDGEWDESETGIAGWTIMVTEDGDTSEPETRTTTTDATGHYAFTGLHAGPWTVSEVQQTGWTQTAPVDPNTCTLNLGRVSRRIDGGTTCNFGNHQNVVVDDSSNNQPSSGGGNGKKVELTSRGGSNDDDGEVLGESITREPTPEVLGEATTIAPLGAPNTGAGGTGSSATGSLLALFGMLASLVAMRMTKRG